MLNKTSARKKRHLKIRKKIFGTKQRPRMCIFKSAKHVYVQIIDDEKKETLCSYSTLNIKDGVVNKGNIHYAEVVGIEIAKKAKEIGIETVVFDRNGYIYHGVVKALADSARANGLLF